MPTASEYYISDCLKQYGGRCPSGRVTLCREGLIKICPEENAELEYKKAMFRLKKTYAPYLRKLYRGFMRAVTWVLLLPFSKCEKDKPGTC